MSLSIPTSYTTPQLAQYMLDVLGRGATSLGLDASDLDVAVIRSLRLYGTTDISAATNMDKLESCARLALWEFVASMTAPDYAFSTDGQRFDRDAAHSHAVGMRKQAKVDAMKFGVNHSAGVLRTRRRDDYYAQMTDDVRKVTS